MRAGRCSTDVTLGISAGERIGVVGANGEGKSTLLRADRGREQPDAGAVDRAGGLAVALLAQTDELDGDETVARGARRRARRARVGGRPRLPRACSTGCSAASRSSRLRGGARDADRGAVGRRAPADRARAAAARRTRAAAARRADQPSRRRGDRLARAAPRRARAARCWSSPTTAGSSTPSAPPRGRSPTARSIATRAATRRTCSRAPSASGSRRRARTAAASWCARSSRGCAAVRRRAPRSRSSGSRRPTR